MFAVWLPPTPKTTVGAAAASETTVVMPTATVVPLMKMRNMGSGTCLAVMDTAGPGTFVMDDCGACAAMWDRGTSPLSAWVKINQASTTMGQFSYAPDATSALYTVGGLTDVQFCYRSTKAEEAGYVPAGAGVNRCPMNDAFPLLDGGVAQGSSGWFFNPALAKELALVNQSGAWNVEVVVKNEKNSWDSNPIPPGKQFTYNFTLSQTGTYWIHGHHLGQYVDGLRAPFVVKDPNEKFFYDHEYTLMLEDWYHQDHATLMKSFMSKSNPDGIEPVPQSALINGALNTTLLFHPARTYRLRLVSAAALAHFVVTLDGHAMEVIEVDGVPVQPRVVSALRKRFSVLVRSRFEDEGTVGNWALRATMEGEMLQNAPKELVREVRAGIVYAPAGKPLVVPDTTRTATSTPVGTSTPTPPPVDQDTLFHPLTPQPPLVPTRHVHLKAAFGVYTDGLNHGAFNGVPYVGAKVPTLLTALTTGAVAWEPKVYGGVGAVVVRAGEVVEVVVENEDDFRQSDTRFFGGIWAVHLHGHHFQVIAVSAMPHAHANGTRRMHKEPLNPARKDIVTVPGRGHAVIQSRFLTPEHIVEAGLTMTFVVAPDKIQAMVPVSRLDGRFEEHCRALGVPVSGNAAGRSGMDLEGAPRAPGLVKGD
ncbi:hypothetical protein HDU96_008738 [Phlyctochytrium bullatum]|nr:hypothetical protein HDU96_008738 [Phlyctochytrium bullatum]